MSEDDRAFLAKHNVQRAVTDAVAHILMTRPTDPIAALGNYLRDLALPKTPKEIFAKYDLDGNGVLSKSEFSRLVPDLIGAMTEEQTQKLMEVIDMDNSGDVGVVELNAFMRMWESPTKTIKTKSALLIIDVQNDFISGTLANPDPSTSDIVPVINGMRDAMDVVIISYDWHPHEHCSFVESANSGSTDIVTPSKPFDPFTMVTLRADADRKEHQQLVFGRHCVQDTWGAECHKDLIVAPTDGKIYKGKKGNIDSFSAFYDNMKINDCGLLAMLEEQGVTHLYVTGLCFDICVMSTALHGAEAGFVTYVVEDACRPLFQHEVVPTKEKLKAAGVSVISSDEAVRLARSTAGKELSIEDYMTAAQGMKGAVKLAKQDSDNPQARVMAPKVR
mmetsp:Transcript_5684/g.15107  ORF Transcript_5684/g.15107 Transcript_5684/m.15107 type:complete len:390 (-) Transcript_5684:465-1634(-)